MLPCLSAVPQNPSSIHSFGRDAFAYLDKSRAQIAAYLDVTPNEIVFTSGGTESLALLLKKEGHIIASDLDHEALFNQLVDKPDVTFLPSNERGTPTPEEIEKAITPRTRLIALSAVNSVTGVKLDVEGVSAVAEAHSIPLILDGVALLGKGAITLPPGVSGMAFSGHKIHGPKGIGFAFVRSSYQANRLWEGGGQENSLRHGTENLPGIVGLAKAIELISPSDWVRMAHLRDLLEEKLGGLINGTGERICNTSSMAFPGQEGDTLLMRLDQAGIAVSLGSACSSGIAAPSRVLTNMGYSKERVLSSLRFSLSRETTDHEIEELYRVWMEIVVSPSRVKSSKIIST